MFFSDIPTFSPDFNGLTVNSTVNLRGTEAARIEEYDLGAGVWQLMLPGGKVIDSTPEGIVKQAQVELRKETGFRAGRFEKLLDLYSHPGYIAYKAHLLVAYDLEWDPLEMDDGEEIRVYTFTLDEALAATREDYGCYPEAALALWLYSAQLRMGTLQWTLPVNFATPLHTPSRSQFNVSLAYTLKGH